MPGIIDAHIHITGAAGLRGPASRSPQMPLSAITTAGITCVVTCLGADNISRQMPELVARALALEAEGISAFAYTGGYRWPPPTLTGDFGIDVALVDRILGVKIAVSEPRAGQASTLELIRLASEVYVAGSVAGKAGVIHVHVGDGPAGCKPLFDLVAQSGIPAEKFVATHVNRSERVLEQAAAMGREGVCIDVTTTENPALGKPKAIKPSQAIAYLLEAGVPVERISMSSDSNNSYLSFTHASNHQDRKRSLPAVTLGEIRDLVMQHRLSVEQVMRFVTTNPARTLALDHSKGSLHPGGDADLVLLDEELSVRWVLAKGRVLVRDGRAVIWGAFESVPAEPANSINP